MLILNVKNIIKERPTFNCEIVRFYNVLPIFVVVSVCLVANGHINIYTCAVVYV